MNQIKESSRVVQTLLLVGDIVLLNLLYYLLVVVFGRGASHIVKIDFILLTLAYLTSVLVGRGGSSDEERGGGEELFAIRFDEIKRFVLIWLSLLAILEFVYHSFWLYMSFFTALIILLLLYRHLLRLVVKRLHGKNRRQCNLLFIGSSANITELYDEMTSSKESSYKVIGYFDSEPNENFAVRYLGRPTEVNDYLKHNRVESIYCSLPSSMKSEILPIIAYCESHLIRYFIVPDLRNYLHRRVVLEMFGETPILRIRTEPLSKLDNRIVKRTFDILFSLSILITIYPIVWLILGIMIKLSSRGPILFKQLRHGINGEEFWCYKFRSMRVNSSADDEQARVDDPRKTKIGDFIRRTSIDELPQFINVLKGDMSVVGPRPHMLKHTEEYSQLIDTYMVRHFVKPGVTGWAQVMGYRGETRELKDMERRVRADIWYMEQWSFTLDILIIYKTVVKLLKREDKQAF